MTHIAASSLLVLSCASFAVYVISERRFVLWATATNLSLWNLFAQAVATFVLAEPGSETDFQWASIALLGFVCFAIGCGLHVLYTKGAYRRACQRFRAAPPATEPEFPVTTVLLLFVAAAIVVIVDAVQVNANALIETVKTLGTSLDVREIVNIRKHSVFGSGDEYTAAGYVYQFRAYILPVIMDLCLFTALVTRRRHPLVVPLGVAALVLTVLSNGVSGQRGGLAIPFFITAYLLLNGLYTRPERRPSGLRHYARVIGVAFVIFAITLYGVLTIGLGRATAGEAMATEPLYRLVGVPASNDLRAYAILQQYPREVGHEWLMGVLEILPNGIEHQITQSMSEVGTEGWLHERLGGSKEGSAPLNRTASLWFNFGLFGVVVVSMVWGYLTRCYDTYWLGRRKTPQSVACWQFAAVGWALAVSPITVILWGFITLGVLYRLLMENWKRKAKRVSPQRWPRQVGTYCTATPGGVALSGRDRCRGHSGASTRWTESVTSVAVDVNEER